MALTTKSKLVLFLACGCGAGRFPIAPGTAGSLVGLLWFAVLLCTGELWIFAVGILAGILASVWLCGAAERIAGKKDPGWIVLDEIVAVPLCFGAWVGSVYARTGEMPPPMFFEKPDTWLLTAVVFAAFRLFDVVKPWPVRQSQRLPGGWGVTADDVLAAAYVNVVTFFSMSFLSPR